MCHANSFLPNSRNGNRILLMKEILNTAIRHEVYGKPLEVLKLETNHLPAPDAGQVLLKLVKAVINPSDFGQILGNYGSLRELPATAGREGLAEIVEIGADVEGFAVGERVRFPNELGTWQSYALAEAKLLQKVPSGVPDDLAAMAWVNPPTAWRLLRDAHLDKGDWVVQNAANSAVGLFVIQMARYLGLRTVNFVRRAELVEPLKALGADVVLEDTDDNAKAVKQHTGGALPRLALNSVGGESGLRLLRCLENGGRHVTFGAMSFEPVRWPTRQLIFSGISMTGFWMDQWYRQNSADRVRIMMDKIFDLMARGTIQAPVAATYPLSEFQKALEHAGEARLGKILLCP